MSGFASPSHVLNILSGETVGGLAEFDKTEEEDNDGLNDAAN